MPSAYLLARDNLEQARAILANDVWFDTRIDHLLDLAISRLLELDATIADPKIHTRETCPVPANIRHRKMPWLDTSS